MKAPFLAPSAVKGAFMSLEPVLSCVKVEFPRLSRGKEAFTDLRK